jgi:hypothetical protein
MESTEAVRNLFAAYLDAERALMMEFSSDFNSGARHIMADALRHGEALGMEVAEVRELLDTCGLLELAESDETGHPNIVG